MAYGVTEILDEMDQHGFEDIDDVQKLKFINDAYYEICMFPYPWLYRTASVSVTAGSNAFTITDPGGHVVDKILGTSNDTNQYTLQPIRLDSLTKNFAGYLTQTGMPTYYYAINSSWFVYPVSDANYTFTVRYTIIPKELGAGDTPIVPIQHRRIITNGALYRAYMMNDDVDIAQYFLREVQNRTKIMQENSWVQQYDRPDYVVDSNDEYQYWDQYT